MKLLAACALLVATTYANPIPSVSDLTNLNQTMTLEKFNQICTIMKEMFVSKGYFPAWAVDPICSLDDETKNALVKFTNDFHAGKLPKPTSNDELVKMMTEATQKGGDVVKSIRDTFYAKRDTLPQRLIDLQKKWEKISFASADADRLTWCTNLAAHAKEYVKDIDSLTESEWAAIDKVFPEFVKMHKSDAAVLFRNLIKDMKDEDLANKEKVKNLMQMTAGSFIGKTAA
ncbi:unnamed protein product [Auanema sp. JU1783]|nr:unnamed protein product [Auanema sp. JU1783]